MIVGSCAAPAAGIRPWPTGAWTATPRLSRKSIPWRDSPGAPCCKLDLGLGTIVDDSVTGILKPDPRAYAADVGAIGAQACDVVFVDDLPRNVAGARAFGMVGIDLDLLRPRVAFERARVPLGLDEAGIPQPILSSGSHVGYEAARGGPRAGHRSPPPRRGPRRPAPRRPPRTTRSPLEVPDDRHRRDASGRNGNSAPITARRRRA